MSSGQKLKSLLSWWCFFISNGLAYLLVIMECLLGLVWSLFWMKLPYNCFAVVFNLASRVRISQQQLKRAYASLSRYLSGVTPHYYLPLRQSEAAVHHFAAVRQLVLLDGIIFLLLLPVAVAVVIFYARKSWWWRWLRFVQLTIGILWMVVFICLINFNSAFIFMHHLLFSDLTWEFNPQTDPIILALPTSYFELMAGILGSGLVTVLGVLYWLACKSLTIKK